MNQVIYAEAEMFSANNRDWGGGPGVKKKKKKKLYFVWKCFLNSYIFFLCNKFVADLMQTSLPPPLLPIYMVGVVVTILELRK